MSKELINVAYRWLAGSELDVLDPILAARGWSSLNKPMTRALVAYDEGDKIVGFLILKLVLHTEPAYVDQEWRGSGLVEELADQVHDTIGNVPPGGVWLVADSPFSAKLAEKHGLSIVESPVYRKAG